MRQRLLQPRPAGAQRDDSDARISQRPAPDSSRALCLCEADHVVLVVGHGVGEAQHGAGCTERRLGHGSLQKPSLRRAPHVVYPAGDHCAALGAQENLAPWQGGELLGDGTLSLGNCLRGSGDWIARSRPQRKQGRNNG